MKFKPKEVLVNLPTVLTFTHEGEDAALAAGFNTFINGKVHLKYETLGMLAGQYVSLFYMQRNNESKQLRDEFMVAINAEEEANHAAKNPKPAKVEDDEDDDDPFVVDFSKMHADRFRRNGY